MYIQDNLSLVYSSRPNIGFVKTKNRNTMYSHPASHQPNSGYATSHQPQQYPYVPNQPVPDPPVFQQQPPGFNPNLVAGPGQQYQGQPQTQYYQQQPGNKHYTRSDRSLFLK